MYMRNNKNIIRTLIWFTYLGRPLPGTFVLNGILPLITKGGGLSWSNAIAHPAVVKRYNDSL